MTAYRITITGRMQGILAVRTITSNTLPRVIKFAHALVDSIWYDFDVTEKGEIIITDMDTGETCWTSTITPYEE